MKSTFKISGFIILIIFTTLCLTSCKKDPVPPVVTTSGISAITQTTATSGGNVTGDGGAEVTARGACWNTSENPTVSNNKTSDGAGIGTFTSSLSQLIPGTKYYVRAYATNEAGTGYGSQQSFNTSEILLATVTTADVTSVTQTTAVSGGNITSDGGGTITARGVCWTTTQNPTVANSKTTDGSGTGSFTSNLTGLDAGTPYYVRAYATNSAGTAYGTEKPFSTEQVKDADGNVYTTATIGTQVWLKENLKTTKYRNGDAIPNITDGIQWGNLTTGAYCNYDNDESNASIYGRLYNWFAVNDSRKICPTGWHVPTNPEWVILTDYLGGESIAGGKLKETGTVHWESPNTGATNESGFTALPGGYKAGWNGFSYRGRYGHWWTSTEGPGVANMREMYFNSTIVGLISPYKEWGFSVRCLKD